MKVDGLIRVSQQDGREGESFRSPTQQREACERWAEANGAEIVAWHEGVGRSGKTMQRTDVEAALERVRGGLTEGVIVAWLDRFSRAPVREALAVYEDFKQAGGRVVAADMAGLNPDDATGEMALTVHLAVNRMQLVKITERYDQTRREAIEDGKAIGGAPFGYRFKDPTPQPRGRGVLDSRLIVCEEEALIVRELFERKAAGATWLELARWLDEVAPKPGGRHWARSTVRRMIECRTYLGEVRHGEHVRAGAHDRIVANALWRQAQGEPGRRTPRGTYLLSGLARCASCGRRMRGTTRGRGAGRDYACDDAGCPGRASLAVGRLDAEVVEQFFAHLDAFHVRAVEDAELDAARKEVERCTQTVESVAGVVPSHPSAVAAHQAALDGAERELIAAEDRLHQLTATMDADGPDVRELRADWTSLTLAEKREILRAGIDAVLVRRAPSPTDKLPAGDRCLVLFHGTAPDGLADNGRSGPITTWTWDDDPASLTSTP